MKAKTIIIFLLITNAIALGLVALFGNEIYNPPEVKEITTSGLGVIDLEVGCDDYYEWAILNEELYDSLVIRVKVECEHRPSLKI